MNHEPSPGAKAYIVTGPTSGIGLRTALNLSAYGTLILVGRNRAKLDQVRQRIEGKGRSALCVVCDFSDLSSIRYATAEILALRLPIVGLLNNAGMMQMRPTKTLMGWDTTFATNHLGPFAFTQMLMPSLLDRANVLFVVSAVEDPDRKPAVAAGFRGGRYISVEASMRGQWQPGGSSKPGFDAYATSKQAALAAAMALARETPRLRINAIEPGFNPTTGLGGGDTGPFVKFVQRVLIPLIVPLFMPFVKILSTPKRAARVITHIMTDASGMTGTYYDEGGRPMSGSALVSDPQFQDRVVSETRAALSATEDRIHTYDHSHPGV